MPSDAPVVDPAHLPPPAAVGARAEVLGRLSGALARPWLQRLLLALLCLTLWAPGLASLPVVDRDEARFAQATRQMLETGDFIAIRFQDEARNKKPVGIHWLQAASVATLSSAAATEIWPYRLPSLLAALGAVLLTHALGRLLFGGWAGVTAGLLLASCLLLSYEARMAKTDATLLFCTTLGAYALAHVWRAARAGERRDFWPWPALFWLAVAAGVLVKGPVILLVLGGAIAALQFSRTSRVLTALRPVPGLALVALCVLPWGIAIQFATDGAFLRDAIGGDFLGKVATAQEDHGAPLGAYLALIPLTFWPGSLLTVMSLPWVFRNRRLPEVGFLLAWIAPAWIAFELAPTKLPHYTLPLFPALALLTAGALQSGRRAFGWRWAVVVPWVVLGCVVSVALVAVTVLSDATLPVAILVASASVVVTSVFGGAFALRRRLAATLAVFGAGTVALALSLWGGVLPGLQAPWIARTLAQSVATVPGGPGAGVAVLGLGEPSLAFHLGTGVVLSPPAEEAARLLRAGWLVAVESREAAAFAAVLPAGPAPLAVGRVTGFNYSKGRTIDLTLYRATPRFESP